MDIPIVVDGKPVAAFNTYSDGSISDSAHAYIKTQTIDFRKIAVEKMKKEASFKVNITGEIRKVRACRDAVSDEDLDFVLSEKSIECSNYKEAYRLRKEKEAADKAEKDAIEKLKKDEEAVKAPGEKEKKRLERLAWAQEHGSDRLRKGLEQGHNCVKLFETELGKYLIQDNSYEYDREDEVADKYRSCPSLAALEEVDRIEKIEGLSALVVWLPEGLTEMHKDPEEYNEPETGCEAVRVDVEGTAGFFWYKTF